MNVIDREDLHGVQELAVDRFACPRRSRQASALQKRGSPGAAGGRPWADLADRLAAEAAARTLIAASGGDTGALPDAGSIPFSVLTQAVEGQGRSAAAKRSDQ